MNDDLSALMRKPSAWLPFLISLTALAFVLGCVGLVGVGGYRCSVLWRSRRPGRGRAQAPGREYDVIDDRPANEHDGGADVDPRQ